VNKFCFLLMFLPFPGCSKPPANNERHGIEERCVKSHTQTTLYPMYNGTTTILMPMNTTVCDEYAVIVWFRNKPHALGPQLVEVGNE
jgi:hypothetical protein